MVWAPTGGWSAVADVADLTVGPPAPPEVAPPSAGPGAPPRAPRAPRKATTTRRTRGPRAGRSMDGATPRDRASAFPPAGPPDGGVLAAIEERQVRDLLRSGSGLLGVLLGMEEVERHWRLTADELDALTPPLTRIVNRTPRLMIAVQHGDEATVAIELARYAGRNIDLARRAKEAQRERERQAEGTGTGPGDRSGTNGNSPGLGREDGVGGARADAGVPAR